MANLTDEPFTLVIFGASGDLTRRKLVPALWSLYAGRTLPEPFAIIGSARSEVGPDEFRLRMRDAVRSHERSRLPRTSGTASPRRCPTWPAIPRIRRSTPDSKAP
jgi:glucose-6-phosphate 1-dehydrogenase